MAHSISTAVSALNSLKDKLQDAYFAGQLDIANMVHRQTVVNIDTMLKSTLRRRRTGMLRNSVNITADPLSLSVKVSIGNDLVPYAFLHEYGGEITPKNRKWLTIPVSERTYKKKARDFRSLSFSKASEAMAFLKFPQSGEIAYLLVKRVKILPTHFASKASETVAQDPRALTAIENRIKEATHEWET